jgi:putative nucleotidyltransferase with HDIG domain
MQHMLVVLFAFLAITTLLSLKLLPPDVAALAVGEVSPRDIEAPRNLEIVDEQATKDAQNYAAGQVKTVFTERNVYPEVDSALTRTFQSVGLMRKMDLKTRDAAAKDLPISLSSESLDALIRVPPTEYSELNRIVHLSVMEVLRDKITDAQLDDARSRVASIIESKALSPPVRAALIEMAQHSLKANSYPDYQRTVQQQQEKMAHVEPVKTLIQKGQMIVRKGEVVTQTQMDILDIFGLHKQTINVYGVLANALFACLMVFVLAAYISQQDPPTLQEPRLLWLLALLVVGALAISRAGVGVSPYLTPIATASLLTAILLDYRLALLVTAFLGLCVGLMTTGSVTSDLAPCIAATITGMVAVLSVTNVARRGDLMIATLVVWLVNVMAVLVVNLWHNEDLRTLTTNALMYGSFNGLTASVLAIGALPFLENIFNVTTHIKLLELSNHTSEPLLQRLMTEAPGTYHHSMIVANLAESAARSISADPLLSKVGAFYHDIGKMKAAHFFVENQLGQENPHDRLTPMLSAHIIISHVQDGVEMARTARLPQVVADFIDMHHGDRLVSYFYHKALQRGEEVQEKDFRYHGRRPRTRETAIVMMADTIEAKARLLAKPTQESLDKMVRESIKVIMDDGQLNDSDLSLRDIERISQAFVKTLMSIYHSRIEYPKDIGSLTGDKKPIESIPSPTV